MSCVKRLTKELTNINKQGFDWCTVGTDEDDIMVWNVSLFGPAQTPYAGGIFQIKFVMPENYPFKPPEITFVTKIFHPNVSKTTGQICADMLAKDWSPTLNVKYCLETLKQMLSEPNADSPVEPEVAEMYRDNHNLFTKTAKEWTKEHAGGE